MFKSCRQQTGFTMIEALVAITILLLAVLGPLSLIAKGLGDALFAKNQITAFYLAEEGLEMVISKRDEFALALNDTEIQLTGDGWIKGYGEELASCFNDASSQGNRCDISISNNTAQPCPADGCLLSINDEGFDDSESGDETIFRRSISINKINDGNDTKWEGARDSSNEAEVAVTVFWTNRDVPKQLTIIGHVSRALFTQ